MARILIAGCGDVGSALGNLLIADGHTVWGLRRQPEFLPPRIQPLVGNLAEPKTLDQLPAGMNVLYYTAAASAQTDRAYRLTYVDGMRNILAALDSGALHRVVYVSSTAVYAQDDGAWVDESSTAEPVSFAGCRLLEGEAMARTSGVSTVVVRLAGIYGPGRRQLLERVQAGASCCDSPPQWTNRIHRDDCAGVLAHVLTLDAPAPVYIGVDHEPAGACEVMDWLAEQLQVRPPVRVAQGASGRGAKKRCSNQLLLDSGYRFKYAHYRQGYSEMIAKYQEL